MSRSTRRYDQKQNSVWVSNGELRFRSLSVAARPADDVGFIHIRIGGGCPEDDDLVSARLTWRKTNASLASLECCSMSAAARPNGPPQPGSRARDGGCELLKPGVHDRVVGGALELERDVLVQVVEHQAP